jgi:hypothetical protein
MYVSLMESEHTKNTKNASAGYAALRHGGAPAWRARLELGLAAARAERMETLFRARTGGGPDDPMKPRYAKHGRHVAEVVAQGGYPVLPDRRR